MSLLLVSGEVRCHGQAVLWDRRLKFQQLFLPSAGLRTSLLDIMGENICSMFLMTLRPFLIYISAQRYTPDPY